MNLSPNNSQFPGCFYKGSGAISSCVFIFLVFKQKTHLKSLWSRGQTSSLLLLANGVGTPAESKFKDQEGLLTTSLAQPRLNKITKT